MNAVLLGVLVGCCCTFLLAVVAVSPYLYWWPRQEKARSTPTTSDDSLQLADDLEDPYRCGRSVVFHMREDFDSAEKTIWPAPKMFAVCTDEGVTIQAGPHAHTPRVSTRTQGDVFGAVACLEDRVQLEVGGWVRKRPWGTAYNIRECSPALRPASSGGLTLGWLSQLRLDPESKQILHNYGVDQVYLNPKRTDQGGGGNTRCRECPGGCARIGDHVPRMMPEGPGCDDVRGI